MSFHRYVNVYQRVPIFTPSIPNNIMPTWNVNIDSGLHTPNPAIDRNFLYWNGLDYTPKLFFLFNNLQKHITSVI